MPAYVRSVLLCSFSLHVGALALTTVLLFA